jgi:hypothetical protein
MNIFFLLSGKDRKEVFYYGCSGMSSLEMLSLRTAKKWEPGVMTWLSMIQLVLVSMIAGVYFADNFRMGSSPFLLLRNSMDAPIFSNPNYLSMITGNGLNPLLQNYWMTIHPPTLFLGFASVSIPFCFAMSGLWQKEHAAWLKPVMPWTLFSTAILGTGILMGGAWAYEALSFGGYWAWDPCRKYVISTMACNDCCIAWQFYFKTYGAFNTHYLSFLHRFVFACRLFDISDKVRDIRRRKCACFYRNGA